MDGAGENVSCRKSLIIILTMGSHREEADQSSPASQDEKVTKDWWEHSEEETSALEIPSDGSPEPVLDRDSVGLIRPDETCGADLEEKSDMCNLQVSSSIPDVQDEAKATEPAPIDRDFSYGFSNRETPSVEDMDSSSPTSLSEVEDACDSEEDTSQHKLFTPEASADIAGDAEAREDDAEVEVEIELSELSEIDDTYALDEALDSAFDSQDSEEVRCVIERAHDKSMLPHPTEVYLPSINLHDIVSDAPLPMSLGLLNVAIADSAAGMLQDGAEKEPERVTALTMGQRTGKHTFFQARERNKAEFGKSRKATATVVSEAKTAETDFTSIAGPMCEGEAKASLATGSGDECDASPHNSEDGLGDKSEPVEARESVTGETKKRKIDFVSEASDDELPFSTGRDAVEASTSRRQIRQPGRDDSARPSKKLKTFMNAAIKVSAGIAVGGAGVFGILAATAPSFA